MKKLSLSHAALRRPCAQRQSCYVHCQADLFQCFIFACSGLLVHRWLHLAQACSAPLPPTRPSCVHHQWAALHTPTRAGRGEWPLGADTRWQIWSDCTAMCSSRSMLRLAPRCVFDCLPCAHVCHYARCSTLPLRCRACSTPTAPRSWCDRAPQCHTHQRRRQRRHSSAGSPS